jgi:hypothetical protein
MEFESRTSIQRILSQCFAAIRSNRNQDESWLNEDRADRELVSYTQKAMREKLAAARLKGRRGWWRAEACSIGQLENLLYEALAKGNMIDVINYAAMIEVRRITDE